VPVPGFHARWASDKLPGVAIRAWGKASGRLDGDMDGDEMVLTWQADRAAAHGRLRDRFVGPSGVLRLGSCLDWPLAAAVHDLPAETVNVAPVSAADTQRPHAAEQCPRRRPRTPGDAGLPQRRDSSGP
jgi:hypothetical protein